MGRIAHEDFPHAAARLVIGSRSDCEQRIDASSSAAQRLDDRVGVIKSDITGQPFFLWLLGRDYAMPGFSLRILVLDEHDRIYRMPVAKFGRMLEDPAGTRLIQFANCRIRSVEGFVQLADQTPVKIMRITHDILTFDKLGRIDRQLLDQHQLARFEVGFQEAGAPTGASSTVLDASSKFLDRGGRWKPSRSLAKVIEEALLDRTKCPRL